MLSFICLAILSSIWLQGRIGRSQDRASCTASYIFLIWELIVVMTFLEEMEDDLREETSFLYDEVPSFHDLHHELQQSERDGWLGDAEILCRFFTSLSSCLAGIGRLCSSRQMASAQSPRTPAPISPLPTLLRVPNGATVPAGVPCHFIMVEAAAPP